jgi:predicted hydrocarbon binding protein
MTVAEALGDVASTLAQMAPSKIVTLKASKKMSDEVERLVLLKKEGTISIEQSTELERYLALDLFISLTKARARTLLSK